MKNALKKTATKKPATTRAKAASKATGYAAARNVAVQQARLPAKAIVSPASPPREPQKPRDFKKQAVALVAFDQIYMYPPQERIEIIKKGIPADHVGLLSAKMDIPKDNLMDTLGLSRATVNRKVREKKALSQDESERVLGIESLIGQVETMIRESGSPEGFDAAKWVSTWLNSPLPALGGRTPASYMDTIEGQKLVANLLAMAQSGAYA